MVDLHHVLVPAGFKFLCAGQVFQLVDGNAQLLGDFLIGMLP
jgi:hypothetical protein